MLQGTLAILAAAVLALLGCGEGGPTAEERFRTSFPPISESMIKVGDAVDQFLGPSDYGDGATTAANFRAFSRDLSRANRKLDALEAPKSASRAASELSKRNLQLVQTLNIAAERAEIVGVSTEPAGEAFKTAQEVSADLRNPKASVSFNYFAGDLKDIGRRVDVRKAPRDLRADVRALDQIAERLVTALRDFVAAETLDVARARALKTDALAMEARAIAKRTKRKAIAAGYRVNFEQDLLQGPLFRMREARARLAKAAGRAP